MDVCCVWTEAGAIDGMGRVGFKLLEEETFQRHEDSGFVWQKKIQKHFTV